MALALTCAPLLMAQLPPLVDRTLYFGEGEVAGAQISRTGNSSPF